MAYFKITTFSGIAPALNPRLLADKVGQVAEDMDFVSGSLKGRKSHSYNGTLTSTSRKTIYKYEYENDNGSSTSEWLEWSVDVDVVEGPVPDDALHRLYWTEADTYPQIGFRDSIKVGDAPYPAGSWRLGVPKPSQTISVSVTGTADEGSTANEFIYVFTIVTNDGREGPPSEPTARVTAYPGQTVTLTMPSIASLSLDAQDNISVADNPVPAQLYIYRSNVGSNTTALQFMTQKTLGDTTPFVDDVANDALQEVIPSETWIGPPDDSSIYSEDGPLQGLIAIAQGMLAGFAGKRFCVSEPFLPHAWPMEYRITLDDDIVGIAGTANGVVALTKRRPYFITGTSPSAMASATVELSQPCLNKDSIVDMGDYVLYAGVDGLCSVQGTAGEVVTRGQVSESQWREDFYPESIKAFYHDGTYVAFWKNGGDLGGWVYDPRSTDKSLSTLTINIEIRGGFTDKSTGVLTLIEGMNLKQWGVSDTLASARFKSKKFVTPKPVSMGWVSVDTNGYPIQVRVFADGTKIADYALTQAADGTITQSTVLPASVANISLIEPIMRLPAIVGQEWEIEVEGRDINEICLAQSIEEIQRS